MIALSDAHKLVADYLKRHLAPKFVDKVVILENNTIEKSYGWIFFYQTRKWVETRKTRDGLIGNGPILIDKNTAKIVQFGSSGSLDYWCELYENGKTREDKDGVIHLLFREDLQQRRRVNGT
jgi:Immunity protein 35